MADDVNRQWVLASRPQGTPTMENFELEEAAVPEPGHDEVLLRTLYMSVDPYMRGRMRDAESYAEPWDVGDVMRAGVVGEVVASNDDDYEPGDVVTGQGRWAEYAAVDGDELRAVDPELGPISTAVGVMGMPGVTAYYGMTEVVDPDPGDTVVVSAAAGAVGSVAGQLAGLAGCRVVGTAGSDAKVEWITDELGYDAGVNYAETDDLRGALAEACPDGVDGYFDNVGGEITDAVWPLLNDFASVGICGQIALYNETSTPTGPRKLGQLIQTRASVEGLLVRDYDQWGHALRRIGGFIASGELQYEETVTEGIENAPEAFLGLFSGENVGKQLVKVGERGGD